MTAVFDVKLDRGGTDANPGSGDVVTNLRFRTDDTNTQDDTNPIPIVSTLTKYSFWRHLYLECTTAPGTKVDNVKFYSDGSIYGTGVALYAGDQFPVKNSTTSTGYEVADGTVGDSGTELVAGHSGITSVTEVHGNFTSGNPLTGPSISEGTSQIDAIGETCNYLLLQLRVIDSASPGTLTADTFTFQYDEI